MLLSRTWGILDILTYLRGTCDIFPIFMISSFSMNEKTHNRFRNFWCFPTGPSLFGVSVGDLQRCGACLRTVGYGTWKHEGVWRPYAHRIGFSIPGWHDMGIKMSINQLWLSFIATTQACIIELSLSPFRIHIQSGMTTWSRILIPGLRYYIPFISYMTRKISASTAPSAQKIPMSQFLTSYRIQNKQLVPQWIKVPWWWIQLALQSNRLSPCYGPVAQSVGNPFDSTMDHQHVAEEVAMVIVTAGGARETGGMPALITMQYISDIKKTPSITLRVSTSMVSIRSGSLAH